MSYFAVTREAGPAWKDGGIFEQPEVNEHAAFMNALAEQGVVLFAGPLAGSEHARVRVLLMVDADGEDEIHRQLADDPWEQEQLVIVTGAAVMLLIAAWQLALRFRRPRLATA